MKEVAEGGHHIPKKVIKRRYDKGLSNFFNLYYQRVDDWMFIDNSGSPYRVLAEGSKDSLDEPQNKIWTSLKNEYEK